MKHKYEHRENLENDQQFYVYHLDLVGKYIKVSISQLPISHRGKSFSHNKAKHETPTFLFLESLRIHSVAHIRKGSWGRLDSMFAELNLH